MRLVFNKLLRDFYSLFLHEDVFVVPVCLHMGMHTTQRPEADTRSLSLLFATLLIATGSLC